MSENKGDQKPAKVTPLTATNTVKGSEPKIVNRDVAIANEANAKPSTTTKASDTVKPPPKK